MMGSVVLGDALSVAFVLCSVVLMVMVVLFWESDSPWKTGAIQRSK